MSVAILLVMDSSVKYFCFTEKSLFKSILLHDDMVAGHCLAT